MSSWPSQACCGYGVFMSHGGFISYVLSIHIRRINSLIYYYHEATHIVLAVGHTSYRPPVSVYIRVLYAQNPLSPLISLALSRLFRSAGLLSLLLVVDPTPQRL